MARMKPVLLLVCGVALVVIVAWQQSEDNKAAAAARTTTPLQLMRPTSAPSANAAVPTVAPPVTAPAAVPANTVASTTKKPVARTEVRSNKANKPVAITASHSNSVPAPLAPSVVKESAAAPVTAENNSEAYEAEAVVRLKDGDYRKAGELFETALRNGGKATFMLIHDHSKGNFEKDPKATCVGELVMTPTEIKFQGADGHQFGATWAEVLDAGSNKFFGSGIGGFHLTISEEGKYKNFNLAPNSKDKQEAKLIIDLLKSNSRKTERGK